MNNKTVIWLLVGGVVSCALLWFLYAIGVIPPVVANIASLVGCVISLFAWGITLYQLSEIQKSTEITNKAVRYTQKQINQLFTVSDISVAISYSNEIIRFVQEEKFDLASLRMQDIKKIIWSIDRIELKLSDGVLPKNKTRIGILLQNLHNYRTNQINTTEFNKEMESVISFLLIIENELKTINHD